MESDKQHELIHTEVLFRQEMIEVREETLHEDLIFSLDLIFEAYI